MSKQGKKSGSAVAAQARENNLVEFPTPKPPPAPAPVGNPDSVSAAYSVPTPAPKQPELIERVSPATAPTQAPVAPTGGKKLAPAKQLATQLRRLAVRVDTLAKKLGTWEPIPLVNDARMGAASALKGLRHAAEKLDALPDDFRSGAKDEATGGRMMAGSVVCFREKAMPTWKPLLKKDDAEHPLKVTVVLGKGFVRATTHSGESLIFPRSALRMADVEE